MRLNDWIEIYPRTDYVDGEYILQEGPPLLRRMTDEEQAAVDKFRLQCRMATVKHIEARP